MNPDKLKQVIFYFLENINNESLGRTKLMKLLYYVDFDHYEQFGSSVTGATYKKLPYGPFPNGTEKLIEQSVQNGELKQMTKSYPKGEQQRLELTNVHCDLSVFSDSERQVLEQVAERWKDATTDEIVEASHSEAPWQCTGDLEEIDYDLAEYRTPIPEEEGKEIEEALANSESFKRLVHWVCSQR